MKILQIAVGISRNPQNQIFITQRAADAHMVVLACGKLAGGTLGERGATGWLGFASRE